MQKHPLLFLFAATLVLISQAGCVSAYVKSIGGDTTPPLSQIYLTDPNTAWSAVIEALKNSRLDVTNREGGFIQTRWTENTAEKNFSDAFGTADAYLKAQYRLRISLAKGTFKQKETVKITVEKEQLVQRDLLDGWKTATTDTVDEKTLLYRVGRLIYLRMKFAKMEQEKVKRELQNASF